MTKSPGIPISYFKFPSIVQNEGSVVMRKNEMPTGVKRKSKRHSLISMQLEIKAPLQIFSHQRYLSDGRILTAASCARLK